MTSRIGIYPGTFDPITVGHRDIIRRALNIVDHLIIAVAQDTGKTCVFDLDARAGMVSEDLELLRTEDRRRITVKPFSGLLVDFARDNRASMLIRGLRAVSDFEYEFQMTCMNARLAPDIETVFLTASENTQFISSRFVKQIARLGGDISQFVSQPVSQKLHTHYGVST